MGPFVAELKRFIERLRLAENDIRGLARDLIRIRQGVRDLWTEGGGGLPAADFAGQVDGCADLGFPFAEVRLRDPGTGTVIQTLTADSDGAFSGTLAMSHGTSQTVDFEATPTGAHAAKFDGPVTLPSVTLDEGANALDEITLLPAEGYCCGEEEYYPGDCGPPCGWAFTVRGCNNALVSGALVEIRQGGVLIDSGTTDGTGVCRLEPPLGTYDVTVSGTGYASQTASRVFSCVSSADVAVAITLAPDSNHVCIAICNAPIPKTLYTSDGLGTHTLTWNGSQWVGTATTSVGVRTVTDGGLKTCDDSGTMTVTYTVNQSLAISVGWKLSCCMTRNAHIVEVVDYVWGNDFPDGGTSSSQPIGATGPVTIGSCSPLSATTDVATVGVVAGPSEEFCGQGLMETTWAGFDTPGGGGLMAVTA